MYERLRAQILPGLIPPQAKILVAVSGGPDSVALAHVLWRYAQDEKDRKLELVLSHINHGVRPESAEEEVLVQGLAERWGLPYVIHRFDAKKYAHASRQSFQEGARAWRYERWEQDKQEYGCTHLATAHHLGDQAETVLYRLLRGSGTAGLAGILPSHRGVLRPLLTVTKEEILAYCAVEGLPYALDRSNEETIYVRNQIRIKLLPQLAEEYNPQIMLALGRTADLMRWDEEYLQGKVEEIWRDYLVAANHPTSMEEILLQIGIFELHPALVSRILRRAAARVSGEPRGLGYDYIVRMMEQGQAALTQENFFWRQDFPGFEIEINSEKVRFKTTRNPSQDGVFDPQVEVPLQAGSWTHIPELGIKVGIFTDASLESVDTEEVAAFDASALSGLSEPLVCRTRRPGDKLWIKGVGHKDLKKVFQEEGIRAEQRSRLPLIAAGSKILWIPGVKRSDAAVPDENSVRINCVIKSLMRN